MANSLQSLTSAYVLSNRAIKLFWINSLGLLSNLLVKMSKVKLISLYYTKAQKQAKENKPISDHGKS